MGGDVALPVLTPQQRADALAKATEARRRRGQALARVKDGGLSMAGFFQLAETGLVLARTRTSLVLRALTGVGAVTAARILADVQIAENRTTGGLGPRQREALLAVLA